MPDRDDLRGYTHGELANFELHANANIPMELVELVFQGFPSVASDLSTVAQPAEMPMDTGGAGASIRPPLLSTAQEGEIVEKLKELGFTPDSLPKRKSGKPWVKSQVKTALGNKEMWAHTTVFDKAWERLRADGRIAESH